MPPSLEENHFSPSLYNSYAHPAPAAYASNLTTAWYDTSTPAHNVAPTPAPAPAPPSSTRVKATPQDIEKLRLLPELRSIPWRKGKQCAPEKSTHSARPQTRGAFLLSTRGVVRNPCTHCETGAGRFALCISLNDWYHGACATCVMATRGNKCSLRQDVEEGLLPPQGQEQVGYLSPDEEEEDGYGQTSSALKRKRSPTRAYVAGYSKDERAEQVPAPTTTDTNNYPSQPTSNTNNYPSYDTPYNATPTQPANQYPSMAPQPTYAPPQGVAVNDKPSLIDYVYQKQYPPNGNKRHQVLHQAERETSQSTNPIQNKRVRIGTESSSMSPSLQLTQPTVIRSETTSTGLIDTLPKKKQREIFGILGGIQSGIRLVRQQTDNLQKQLDSLHSALGIDLDDEEV